MSHSAQRPSRRRSGALPWLVAALAIVAAGASTAAVLSRASSPAPASIEGGDAGPGTTVRLQVPAAVRRLPLVNQHGKTIDLAFWQGRTVLLVPFLSLCQDVCPLITGNLLQVEQSLHADHAASQVEIVELTIDPGRDTPARLRAYQQLTGADWQLVTERPAELRRLAKFFGFYYQKVPEENPPTKDWLTGKPLTYDVDHTDDYVVIDPSGVERVVNDAAPSFHGRLNPKLYKFLDGLGRQHLSHAPQPDWTPADVLQALALTMPHSVNP